MAFITPFQRHCIITNDKKVAIIFVRTGTSKVGELVQLKWIVCDANVMLQNNSLRVQKMKPARRKKKLFVK